MHRIDSSNIYRSFVAILQFFRLQAAGMLTKWKKLWVLEIFRISENILFIRVAKTLQSPNLVLLNLLASFVGTCFFPHNRSCNQQNCIVQIKSFLHSPKLPQYNGCCGSMFIKTLFFVFVYQRKRTFLKAGYFQWRRVAKLRVNWKWKWGK